MKKWYSRGLFSYKWKTEKYMFAWSSGIRQRKKNDEERTNASFSSQPEFCYLVLYMLASLYRYQQAKLLCAKRVNRIFNIFGETKNAIFLKKFVHSNVDEKYWD